MHSYCIGVSINNSSCGVLSKNTDFDLSIVYFLW